MLNDNLLEISKNPEISFVTEFIQADLELSKLRKLHKTLNDISRDVSDFYGQPILNVCYMKILTIITIRPWRAVQRT